MATPEAKTFCKWLLSEKNHARYQQLIAAVDNYIKAQYVNMQRPISRDLVARRVRVTVIRPMLRRFYEEKYVEISTEDMYGMAKRLVEILLKNYPDYPATRYAMTKNMKY